MIGKIDGEVVERRSVRGTGQNHPAWAREEMEEPVPPDGRVEIEEDENDGADP